MIYREDIKTELENVFQTDRHQWTIGVWDRAVNEAVRALSDDRPLHLHGDISLVAGTRCYLAEADLIAYIGSSWGDKEAACTTGWLPVRPRIWSAQHHTDMMIEFSFPITNKLLSAFGSNFEYHYKALHKLATDATDTVISTIRDEDRDALFTFASAVCLRDLVSSNVTEPVQMNRGVGSAIDYTGSPKDAYKLMMNHYKGIIA